MVCLQNVLLHCSTWHRTLVLHEDQGEEEAFDLLRPYQSSRACPGPCCLQNSAAVIDLGVSCSHQSIIQKQNYPGKKQSFFFSPTAGHFSVFNHCAYLTSLPFQTVQTNCSTKVAIGREYSEAGLGCSVLIGHITHMVSFLF